MFDAKKWVSRWIELGGGFGTVKGQTGVYIPEANRDVLLPLDRSLKGPFRDQVFELVNQ